MHFFFVTDDISVSGFKEGLNEQISTEGTNVTLAQEADEAQSPDAISAASQSIDEPTKDLVINSFSLFFHSPFYIMLNLVAEQNNVMMHLLVSMYKISVLHAFAGVGAGFEDSLGLLFSGSEG